VKGYWGLHGRQAQKLEEVVLDHVPECPGMIEVASPALQCQGLVPDDFDALYVVAVPQRFEDAVGEAQAHNRWKRLPGEEVVDAEDSFFGEKLVQQTVEHLGRFEVLSEGLFDSDPAPFRQVRFLQGFDRRREYRGRQGQVSDYGLVQGAQSFDDAVGVGHVGLALLQDLDDEPGAGAGGDAARKTLQTV
jgi:hypothetical protein